MTTETLSDAPPLLRWLDQAVQRQCSDLHLVSGYAPVFRMNGKLVPIDGEAILTSEAICDLLGPIWTSHQRARMELERNLDYAIELPMHQERCRFRVNLFRSSGSIGACVRIIHTRIPDFACRGLAIQTLNVLRRLRRFSKVKLAFRVQMEMSQLRKC